MRCRKSSLVWIILSVIILFTGMCSEIERTDSFSLYSKQVAEASSIQEVKSESLYIGNATNEDFIMNVFMIIFFLLEAVVGFASSIYILISLFATIGYKIYRKSKYGISLYD